MAFELTPRQMRTVAAAVTTVAAVIIVIAAGLLGWLIVLFVRTFSGVFLPLVVGAVAALVFRPYYDWLRGPGRMPVAAAVAAVFLSALVPLAAFIAFFGSLAVRQLLGLAEQAPELWEKTSGPSLHNLRIDGLEFAARIVDLHLPVDTALRAVDVGGPCRHFVVQRPDVADATAAHALARHRAQFVLRDVQPAPVFRRVAELDATNQFPCPGRLEHFVEGARRVRVEVVAHQGDLRAVGVAPLQQRGDLQRPVRLRTPGPGRRLTPTRQRLAEQEDRGRTGPFVFVVDAARPLRRGGQRRAHFLDQLHRLLVHAHDGTIRVVRFLIQIQDLFHVRHELGIGLRRDHPILDFPLRQLVFFSVRRMVSRLIDSTIANSTTRRASRRNDQLA